MKKPVAVIAFFCLLLAAAAAYSGSPAAFTERDASITVNGAATHGRVFVPADDPAVLLVLSGDAAFLVNRTAKTVYAVAINSLNDKVNPVVIDYGVLSEVEGAGLIVGADGSIAFLFRADRYDIRPQGRGYLGPE